MLKKLFIFCCLAIAFSFAQNISWPFICEKSEEFLKLLEDNVYSINFKNFHLKRREFQGIKVSGIILKNFIIDWNEQKTTKLLEFYKKDESFIALRVKFKNIQMLLAIDKESSFQLPIDFIEVWLKILFRIEDDKKRCDVPVAKIEYKYINIDNPAFKEALANLNESVKPAFKEFSKFIAESLKKIILAKHKETLDFLKNEENFNNLNFENIIQKFGLNYDKRKKQIIVDLNFFDDEPEFNPNVEL